MKQYLILKDFKGSQDGIDSESFDAGTTRKLSDPLVAALGGITGGFVKEAAVAAAEIAVAPAVLTEPVLDTIAEADPQPEELAETLEEAATAEDRETKVKGPAETKPDKKKGKK